MRNVNEIFIIAVLVDKLIKAKGVMTTSGSKVVVVDTITTKKGDDSQVERVIEYFMLQNETRNHIVDNTLDSKIYDKRVWDEVIKPNLKELSEDIMDEFNINEPYAIKFDHIKNGDFCMLLTHGCQLPIDAN